MTSPSQYRYDTITKFSMELKALAEGYAIKIKKYRRRITVIDVTVYSVSGVMAGTGIILSSVTMIAPIAVPIAISAVTTIAGVANAITKKLSSCSQEKLNDYTLKHQIASNGYTQLSTLMSSSIDDSLITAEEFSAMVNIYDSAISKLETTNNNNDGITSTNSGKYRSNSKNYKSGTNEDDINIINKTGI